jgi:hypothetical protein
MLSPDRNTPGWLWGVCGAAVVGAVVVAWLLPGGAGSAQAGTWQAAQPGVVREGFLIREGRSEPREFDVRKCLVKPEELVALSVPREGIKALDRPVFVPAAGQSVRPDELVLGLKIGKEVRCYPLRILAWHGVVNDDLSPQRQGGDGTEASPPGERRLTPGPSPSGRGENGTVASPPGPLSQPGRAARASGAERGGERPASLRVTVSFDPVANAGVAIEAGKLTFGVSGRAYSGEGLVCDRETGSLWSFLRGKALSGPAAGARPKRLLLERMTFAAWCEQHAKTLVLSEDTGHDRPYEDEPYTHALIKTDGKTVVDYWREDSVFIAPLPKPLDLGKFRAKELVLGVDVGGVTRAYPLSELAVAGGPVQEQVGGQSLKITYDPRRHYAAVAGGGDTFSVVCFWGAWRATHPETTVYEAPRKGPGRRRTHRCRTASPPWPPSPRTSSPALRAVRSRS